MAFYSLYIFISALLFLLSSKKNFERGHLKSYPVGERACLLLYGEESCNMGWVVSYLLHEIWLKKAWEFKKKA